MQSYWKRHPEKQRMSKTTSSFGHIRIPTSVLSQTTAQTSTTEPPQGEPTFINMCHWDVPRRRGVYIPLYLGVSFLFDLLDRSRHCPKSPKCFLIPRGYNNVTDEMTLSLEIRWDLWQPPVHHHYTIKTMVNMYLQITLEEPKRGDDDFSSTPYTPHSPDWSVDFSLLPTLMVSRSSGTQSVGVSLYLFTVSICRGVIVWKSRYLYRVGV